MGELTLLNEDGEIAFKQTGIKGLDHARAFVRDFNSANYHKFMGRYEKKLINWDGKLVK